MNRKELLFVLGISAIFGACSSVPTPKMTRYAFPHKEAFIGDVKRPYDKLGQVRAKVNFPTLDPNHDEGELCRNYFNKAIQELVRRSKDHGGDAVIDVRSVVFYEGGKSSTFQTPECSDDGQEGQILTQAIAIKWKPEPTPDAEKSSPDKASP